MSATIPETMLLSDLLKSTGYDCPEAAVGKTVSEIVSGGDDVTLEDNKTASVNVSSYSTPVEVTPSEGKDGMKKATITLTNIPSSTAVLSAWKADTTIVYTKVAEPTTSDKVFIPATTGITEGIIASVADEFASITISETVYTRYSDGDVTL